MKLLVTAVIIVIFLAAVGEIMFEKTPEQQAAANERYEKLAIRSDAKEAVKRRLKDPDSAKFQNVGIVYNGELPIVCGQVNSKNGFGAYTGYQHFISLGGGMTWLEEQVDDFAKVWNEYCVG